jgi:hypothetical protein
MRRSLFVGAFLLLALPRAARAQAIKVTIDPGPGAQFAQQAGVPLDTLRADLETELTHLFQTYRLHDYLQSFGDAQSFATRGMGVDYGSNFKALMVGLAGNLSLNVEKGYVPRDTKTRPPAAGMGTNLTFMGGVNLGLLGLDGLRLFGNWFQRSGSYDELGAELSNWGVHLQLKLFGPGEERLLNALLRWGGFDITTGVEHANLQLSLGGKSWKRQIPVGMVAGESARIDLDIKGSFTMNTSTFSIPLELTTNLRLLYVLSLYGGIGFDWQLGGESEMAIELGGRMVGVIPSRSVSMDVGGATISASDSTTPSKGRLRGLLGLQANILFVKLFLQLNVVPQDPVLASVGFGARVAF